MTIVAAIVVGLGFGFYQLRGRIQEKKDEERFEHKAEQVEQMQQQQYQTPGGQWQQPSGYGQKTESQQDWSKLPDQG